MCRSKNAGVAGYAEAFRPVQSDSQTSEWYSYFENDVLVHKMYGLGCTDYRNPGKLQDQKEASGERYELYLYTPLRRRDIVLRMDQ